VVTTSCRRPLRPGEFSHLLDAIQTGPGIGRIAAVLVVVNSLAQVWRSSIVDGARRGMKWVVVAILAVLLARSAARAADEERAASNPGKQAIPADLTGWMIRYDGFAGTPGDRSWFRVALAHDGQIKVEKRRIRQGGFRTVLETKLNPKETDEFFRRSAGIVNEYRHNKSIGTVSDGWHLTLCISSESFGEKSVRFQDHEADGDAAPPGFDDLAKIINRHLVGEHFPE